MEIFIIYAALAYGELTSLVQFKGSTFKSMDECTAYLKDNEIKVWGTLNQHITMHYPQASVAHVGCSPLSAFREDTNV
tara:strand:- start:987 stop:1220 length:234 start_codon:yes stop_codon:yes gene_type:complete